MNLETKIINVVLNKVDDKDVLVFEFDNSLVVNLNSETSQNELKNVFSQLLKEMLKFNIKLKLKIAEGYKAGLYIDVCKEYINELNREIKQLYPKMEEIIGLSE